MKAKTILPMTVLLLAATLALAQAPTPPNAVIVGASSTMIAPSRMVNLYGSTVLQWQQTNAYTQGSYVRSTNECLFWVQVAGSTDTNNSHILTNKFGSVTDGTAVLTAVLSDDRYGISIRNPATAATNLYIAVDYPAVVGKGLVLTPGSTISGASFGVGQGAIYAICDGETNTVPVLEW